MRSRQPCVLRTAPRRCGRTRTRWSVAAKRITVVEASGIEGEEAELVTTEGRARRSRSTGAPVYGSVPSFERVGEAHGSTYVVRAERDRRRPLAGGRRSPEADRLCRQVRRYPVPRCLRQSTPREGLTLRRRQADEAAAGAGRVHRHARARLPEALGRRVAGENGGIPAADRAWRAAREPAVRGLRSGPRGALARVRPAHVRRPDDGRDRPARGRHRRDEDRRGQDLRREHGALPERARR